ncbi:hypothetical protein [Neptuniibacter sp. QD48_11]|uniref:hypothetical protein n=1 Tax=Neptuniibacter sp. QD48_11 TaxID=3398211 RepID=UPI0039F62B25
MKKNRTYLVFVLTIIGLTGCSDSEVTHAPVYSQCIGLIEPYMQKAKSLHGTETALTLFDKKLEPSHGVIGFISVTGEKKERFLNTLSSLCYPISRELYDNTTHGAKQVLSRVQWFEKEGRDYFVHGDKGKIGIYFNDTPEHIVKGIIQTK